MKKIIICILVVALSCIALTSCLEKEEKENEKEKSEGMEEIFNAEKPTAKERVVDEIEARYRAGEENGYSIYGNQCIDSKGYATFTLDDEEECIMCENEFEYDIYKVYNGVVLTQINDVFRLRSAIDGKIIYTTENTPNVKVLLFNKADLLYKDGYIMLYERNESFDGVNYKIGLMNINGEWTIPLSENNPILETFNEEIDVSFLENYLFYLGEKIVGVTSRYLYNIENNVINKIESNGRVYEGYAFENGFCIPCCYEEYSEINQEFLKIFADGKVEKIPCTFHQDLDEIEGNCYYDEKSNKFIVIGYVDGSPDKAIFDSNGNKIKDFKGAFLVNSKFNKDGKAQLILANTEGSCFYTVIDLTGEFLFEPIKIESRIVFDCNGNYIFNDFRDSSTRTLVNDNGKILIDTYYGGDDDIGVNNGVLYDGQQFIELQNLE